MKRVMVIALGVLAAAGTVFPQQVTWKVDQVHSRVQISVRHMVISEVTGLFNEFDATFVQSADDFSNSKIEAVIKANSIDTNNEKRDNHLRSADFLDAANYPEITFTSTSVEKTGENTYKVTGDLTIRDVTKTVVLDTKYFGEVIDPYGRTRAGFKATTSINRIDYGVSWNALLEGGGLIVSETVGITLNMELVKQE